MLVLVSSVPQNPENISVPGIKPLSSIPGDFYAIGGRRQFTYSIFSSPPFFKPSNSLFVYLVDRKV